MQTTSGSTTQNSFLVSFAATALKLEKGGPTFSSFNPCPSLSSAVMNGRKQLRNIKYSLKWQT